MRLIPPTIAESTKSGGERVVFDTLAASTRSRPGHTAAPDTSSWIVLHSLDIADHRRQLAGEIDFLCIVPGKGVLVLEVKGCHSLRRVGGDWYYGDAEEPDHRGPFRQASEAMHSLRRRLAESHPELSGVPFWSAVCFPFIEFDEASPEWRSWQVIDRRALRAQPMARLIEAVLDQARALLAQRGVAWFRPERAEPTAVQCELLAGALRPDFEFFESPKSRLLRLDAEVRRYTEEQYEALEAIDVNPRLVFCGPAGTGKTLLAIEAARRAAARGRRVLLLCFNRPLGKWLQEETAGLAPNVIARTLHEHLRVLAGIEPTRAQQCRQEFWQEELPALALEALLESERCGERCVVDEIILDEAQDVLRRSYLDVLDLSLKGGLTVGHWRFFGDFDWQRIYDPGALTVEEFLNPPVEARAAGAAPIAAMRCALRVNCRNTPRVARFAESAGGVSPGYRRVRRPDDRTDPEVRLYGNRAEQLALLREALAELRDAGYGGQDVAVISSLGNEDCAAAGLTEQPWRDRLAPLVREPGEEDEQEGDWVPACIPSDLDAVDLRSGKIKYASIYRFKGLEAPVVIITDVDALDTPLQRSLLYVGSTRALHRLVILADWKLRPHLKV